MEKAATNSECPQTEEGNNKSYTSTIKTPPPALAPLTPNNESEPCVDTSTGEERGDGEEHMEKRRKRNRKTRGKTGKNVRENMHRRKIHPKRK